MYDVAPTVRLPPSMPLPPSLGSRNLQHVILMQNTEIREPTFAPDEFSSKEDSSGESSDSSSYSGDDGKDSSSSIESTSVLESSDR